MSLTAVQQWLSVVALLIGIANAAWIWISRPARDTNKRIDETNERVDDLAAAADARADRHREDLKNHDRRIQKLEDVLPHMPTKDDLHGLDQKITRLDTHVTSVSHTVQRIDDFLRRQP
ncbi:DUF2730 family protein [Novosphingobium huizhouense]|uniref:DUF2730 family protein n=1 Tax=Novosphingobium huizhouense TaxID=2866625 RepID=UPI001CD83B4D|nr:DUF2730 family protein [Novosphingobium huizhouense]